MVTATGRPLTQFLTGDALTQLRKLPDASVNCCVTSPPYWGLRDYGTAKWEGGKRGCDHRGTLQAQRYFNGQGFDGGRGTAPSARRNSQQYRDACGKCGARRIDAQIGLEKSPTEYVARMVELFREVRRVLRDDGTLWLNLGDSYAATTKGNGGVSHSALFHATAESGRSAAGVVAAQRFKSRKIDHGLKPKDLVGIPWRVAFALQADGWYLRSDIIWHKPNPMPESVTDRPTKAHECSCWRRARGTSTTTRRSKSRLQRARCEFIQVLA